MISSSELYLRTEKNPRADRITMLTLHASKSLEFPVVFIVAATTTSSRCARIGADVDHAKERCLMFVGMTRSTTRLILISATSRGPQSPFLSSIDRSLLDLGGSEAAGQRKRRPAVQQLTML